MPRLCIALTLILLLVSACAGGGGVPTLAPTLPADAAENTPEAAEEADSEGIADVQLTLAPPIPGTLVVAAPTVGEPTIVLEFDDLLFTRSGGLVGQPITITVLRDGTVTRNGVSSTITPEQVEQIRSRLDRINFFQLQGIFTGGASSDVFSYSLTVNGNLGSRTIYAEDGRIPPELIELFTLLAGLGVTADPPTPAPATARPTNTPVPTPSL
jgi:hypothetical protein